MTWNGRTVKSKYFFYENYKYIHKIIKDFLSFLIDMFETNDKVHYRSNHKLSGNIKFFED